MIVRRYLLWIRTACAADRARAADLLARVFLAGVLAPADHREAEAALTSLLDDPSPHVRRALAEAFADAPEAPRHLILALAGDQGEVAVPVLARSPLLSDSDLVDCAAVGDGAIQTAIARRPSLPAPVAAALAEVGTVSALVALAANREATIPDFALARMIERHGGEADLREALLARPDLPLAARQAIAVALAAALTSFVVRRGWLSSDRCERACREAQERTTLALAAGAAASDVTQLVSHLRRTAQLTPVLLLRALLSGGVDFVAAALADLAQLPLARALGLMQDRCGAGFAPLYRQAGLPPHLWPVFRAALAACHEIGVPPEAEAARLCRPLVQRSMAAGAALPPEEGAALTAVLHRFDVEAAREEARRLADALAEDAARAVLIEADRSRPLGRPPAPALLAAA